MTFIQPSSPITTNRPPLKLTYVTPCSLRGTSVASACPQSSPLSSSQCSFGEPSFPSSLSVVGWSQAQGQHVMQVWPISHSDDFRDGHETWPTQCTSQPQDFAGSLRKEVRSSVLRLLRGPCTNQELLVSPCKPIRQQALPENEDKGKQELPGSGRKSSLFTYYLSGYARFKS